MENNVFIKFLNSDEYFQNVRNEALQKFNLEHPNASFEEYIAFCEEFNKRNPNTDFHSKKESLGVFAAEKLGVDEEQLKAMIDDITHRGWNFYPEIVDEIQKTYGYNRKISTDPNVPDEHIKMDMDPKDFELTSEVATFIYNKINSEAKIARITHDTSMSR